MIIVIVIIIITHIYRFDLEEFQCKLVKAESNYETYIYHESAVVAALNIC